MGVGAAERDDSKPKAVESSIEPEGDPKSEVIASILPRAVDNPYPQIDADHTTRFFASLREDRDIATYRDKFDDIRQMLVEHQSLALLYIDASGLSAIEQDYGSQVYEDVLRLLTNLITEMRGQQTRIEDLVTINEKHGDVFLVFLSKKRKERPFGRGDLEHLVDRIHRHLSKRIYRMTSSYLRGRPKVNIGYGLVLHNPLINEERLILKLIEEARRMSKFQAYRFDVKNKELLQEIILKEDVRTVFQPIVNMRQPSILGYEALARGPRGSEFESPYTLFDIAMESDLMFELDRLCRRKALMSAADLQPEHKLFVNTLPMTIRDPDFHDQAMIESLDSMNLDPSRIVLEVTERLAIENYDLFIEAMNYFTDIGFAVAVDDMGAGYSGLEKVVHLKPAYLKCDLLMVREIDSSFVKREMLKAISSLAEDVGAHVVAEGIETEKELLTLLDLGITYGQGFFFSRPSPAFVGLEDINCLGTVLRSSSYDWF
jgi:EAL domain-containing protein (putative c-di-GMP-specific phosphodiesterase class I)